MSKIHLLLLFTFLSTSLFALTDKYRCTLRDDPATTMVIGWNQISGANAQVYYDVVDYGTNTANYAFTHGVDRSILNKGMNNQFARLTGLLANTVYYFVIQDDNSISARFSFKTAPDTINEPLSFIAGGDSRNNQVPRQHANSLVAKTRPNAVLFGGDMTNGDSATEWQEWFDDWQLTTAPDGRMTPVLATRGNHEWNNQSIYDLFDTPSPDVYYACTFGGHLFRAYTLNSMMPANGDQRDWLETDLEANKHVLWSSAQYHHPMRPHISSKPERNDLVENWAPLFEKYGLDFAVECDAHTVKSTYPIRVSNDYGSCEGFIRDDKYGVIYIGEGCWGAPLRTNNDDKTWTKNSGSFNQIKWIFITESRIEIRTIKTDNAPDVDFLTDANRFELPTNIDIWTPRPHQDVTVISEFYRNGKLQIYPNPTAYVLNIKLQIMPHLYPLRIELWDLMGQQHASVLTHDELLSMDISFMPQGVYLLRVVDKDLHVVSMPFVISR